jgi:hypothetical protein
MEPDLQNLPKRAREEEWDREFRQAQDVEETPEEYEKRTDTWYVPPALNDDEEQFLKDNDFYTNKNAWMSYTTTEEQVNEETGEKKMLMFKTGD